jgi:hypothetical protein
MAVQDVITLSVIIVVLTVSTVIGGYVFTQVVDGLLATGGFTPDVQTVVSDTNAKWMTYADFGIAFWFFLLWVVGLLLAFFNETSRVFFAVYVLLFIASFFPLVSLGTFMSSFVDGFSVGFDDMPITKIIIDYWAIFVLFFGASIGFALYMKSSQGGQQV